MSRQVMCGNVAIGGGAPVSIQSMVNVSTENISAAVAQVEELAEAGCHIVRIAVPNMAGAKAFGEIKKRVSIPLVADIHFDYRLALKAIDLGADKVRINPGNIGSRERVKKIVQAAGDRGIPIRIGVNSGSLEKDILKKYGGVCTGALVESALFNARLVEDMGFKDIVLSLKSSHVKMTYEACMSVARQTDYPLHIGVTEAGTRQSGPIKSAVGIGALLLAGVGDTVRVSLTGNPVEEVRIAGKILAAAGLKKEPINLVACPTCGRTHGDLESLAESIEQALIPVGRAREKRGLPGITVAVMGCEVNGPGEAASADLGVACGRGRALLFEKGRAVKTVEEEDIITEIIHLAEEKDKTFG